MSSICIIDLDGEVASMLISTTLLQRSNLDVYCLLDSCPHFPHFQISQQRVNATDLSQTPLSHIFLLDVSATPQGCKDTESASISLKG